MSCISPNIELTWTKVSFWNFLGLNNKGKVLLSLKFTGRNALISLEPRLSLKGRILCEWVIVPYHHWDKRKNIKVSVYSIQSSHLVISKIIILWYERATFLLQFVINLDYIDHNVYLPQSFFAYSPSRAASLVNSALHERCRVVFQDRQCFNSSGLITGQGNACCKICLFRQSWSPTSLNLWDVSFISETVYVLIYNY